MTCKDVSDFLLDYLEGRLPALRRLTFEAHVALCRDCRRYIAGYKRAIRLGKAALSTDDDLAAVPEELIQAILTARKRGS